MALRPLAFRSPVSRGSVYVRAKIGAKHFLMSGTTPLHDFEMKAAQYIVKFIRVASVGE